MISDNCAVDHPKHQSDQWEEQIHYAPEDEY